MRIVVDAAVAVRSDAGLLYGVLRAVNGLRVAFELDGSCLPGEYVELQVELKGYGRTMVLRAEILEALARNHAPSRYIANIEFRSPTDGSLFAAWLEGIWRAGSSLRSRHPEAPALQFQPEPLKPEEVESAFRRLDGGQAVEGTSASQTTAPSDLRIGVGREAMRAALHSALARDLAAHIRAPAFQSLTLVPEPPAEEARKAPESGILPIGRHVTVSGRAKRA